MRKKAAAAIMSATRQFFSNDTMRKIKPISAMLAIFLLIAQTGALAHAYEHDPGSPQEQVCSICIAGQAVGSGCVDSSPHFEFPSYRSPADAALITAYSSIRTPLARQRAPPAPL